MATDYRVSKTGNPGDYVEKYPGQVLGQQIGNGNLNLNGLIPDQPTPPGQVGLDPGSQKLVNSGVKQSEQDPSYFSGLLNQGVGQSQTSLGQDNQHMSQQAESMGMPVSQLDSIRSAYQQHAAKGIQQVYDKNNYQGQLMKADYMHQMSNVLLGQQQMATNSYQQLTQAYLGQEMGRAQTINSLFQAGDTAYGMQKGNQFGKGRKAPGASGGSEAQSGSYEAPSDADMYNGGNN